VKLNFMNRLFYILLLAKARKQLNFGCCIMIALITLQSAFAVADTCASSWNDEQLNEYQTQSQTIVADLITKSESVIAQDVSHDDCLDCSCKCCPCCSSVTFTLASINEYFDPPTLITFGLHTLLFETPYYSLLRPPKKFS